MRPITVQEDPSVSRKAHELQIKIKTIYLSDQSQPDADRYTFAYTVTMQNTGTIPLTSMTQRRPSSFAGMVPVFCMVTV